MDAKKLGAFISQRRKELNMTQADLAEKIQVTDKAVSRWERGLGLPDINTVEPLAIALDVSLAEVMKAERICETMTDQDTTEVIKDVLSMVERKRAERKRIYLAVGCTALLIALILVFDSLGGLGFLGIFLPMLGLVAGICLIIISIHQRLRKLPCKTTLIIGLALLSLPVLFEILLVLGFLIGGGLS